MKNWEHHNSHIVRYCQFKALKIFFKKRGKKMRVRNSYCSNKTLRPCRFARLQRFKQISDWPCYWILSGQRSSMWQVFAQFTHLSHTTHLYTASLNNAAWFTNTHSHTQERQKLARADQDQIIQSIYHGLGKNDKWVRNQEVIALLKLVTSYLWHHVV